jgi:hypothetical protein
VDVGITGRITHPGAQVVQGFQDVGVATQQPGHQGGQEEHDSTQDYGQCDHGVDLPTQGR